MLWVTRREMEASRIGGAVTEAMGDVNPTAAECKKLCAGDQNASAMGSKEYSLGSWKQLCTLPAWLLQNAKTHKQNYPQSCKSTNGFSLFVPCKVSFIHDFYGLCILFISLAQLLSGPCLWSHQRPGQDGGHVPQGSSCSERNLQKATCVWRKTGR